MFFVFKKSFDIAFRWNLNLSRSHPMCLSIFFAFVIGSYLALTSLSMLVNQQRFRKIMHEFLADQPLLLLSGSYKILFGLVVVTTHNMWVSDWTVLITLVGWFFLLEGIARTFVSDRYVKTCKELYTKSGYTLTTWFWLLIGLYLVWAGFTFSGTMMAGQ